MLESALTQDQQGRPLLAGQLTSSREWSDVNSFCHRAYMPLVTRPLNRGDDPNATLRKLLIGRITFSRFCFGVPTRVDEFDPAAGNILVVNTLRGSVRHPLDNRTAVDTVAGQSYVVDCSRTDYWNIADGHDLQFNLTIPHRMMEETTERWFGFVPDDKLWTHRCVFGTGGSAWLALLDYASKSIDATVNAVPDPLIEKRLEDMICLDLLRNWSGHAGIRLDTGARAAAPKHVRDAEKLMEELAPTAPSIAEIAEKVGVSARSLSEGFRRFRGVTPHAHLKARRLDLLRSMLGGAARGQTVASIARPMGFVNLGGMAKSYSERFGETPYQTLRGSRRS
ncbi:AraC family transcriptional regulator (plasmid) [Rhizobium sp. ACO-34A]|nr:AraC family transcriptional regulator [Rhizobium sp. ACO-34A]